jgi:hypothetical protein
MFASTAELSEQRLRVTMETHVALNKVAPASTQNSYLNVINPYAP